MKIGKHKKDTQEKGQSARSDEAKKSSSGSFIQELRKRKIIETLAAFIGGGWLIMEFVHWILIDHYHFPEKSLDITFITLLCALVCTLVWLWFRGGEKRPRKIKVEFILISLLILVTAFFDIKLILQIGEPEIEKISETEWENSIAVLPFADISLSKNQEYFSEGMTDAIIARLSRLGELKVISRTSVMRYKTTDKDIKDIGKELGVAHILEGTIQKEGNRVRIRAQLINASDGFHLWSQTYDQRLESIFSLQDEISHAIVDALRIKIAKEESSLLEKHFTEDVDAYVSYLKGRARWNERTREGMREGMEHFQQAIEKDQDYALAFAGIADTYIGLANLNVLRPKEAYPQAREWAKKALKIDNSLAEAHASMALIKFFYDWDWMEAERKFKRTIGLNPGYATAYQTYALYLAAVGRLDEAKKQIQRARELDPYSLPIQTALGFIFYLSRQYNLAVEVFDKITSVASGFPMAHFYLGVVRIQQSKYDEGLVNFEEAFRLSGANIRVRSWLAHTYALMGRKEKALKILDELRALIQHRFVDPSFMALIYMGLGEKDRVFEWLKKGYEERSFWLVWLKVDPFFDSIRSDQEFRNLMRRMKIDSLPPVEEVQPKKKNS